MPFVVDTTYSFTVLYTVLTCVHLCILKKETIKMLKIDRKRCLRKKKHLTMKLRTAVCACHKSHSIYEILTWEPQSPLFIPSNSQIIINRNNYFKKIYFKKAGLTKVSAMKQHAENSALAMAAYVFDMMTGSHSES